MSDAARDGDDLAIPAILDRTHEGDVLATLAHEINVRLQKADDHRLSAALKLAEAKAECERQGITFKSWVAQEIKGIGYPEATVLAKIGGSADPVKALADRRRQVREATSKGRARAIVHVNNSTPAIAPPTRGKAAIVHRVREAIAALSGLPPAAEVVGYLQGTDEAVLVGENLSTAVTWLIEFADAWEEAQHAEATE